MKNTNMSISMLVMAASMAFACNSGVSDSDTDCVPSEEVSCEETDTDVEEDTSTDTSSEE